MWERFGKRLATLRVRRGLSQAEAAKKCGWKSNVFAQWERGRGMRVAQLERVVRGLEFSDSERLFLLGVKSVGP